MIEQARQTEDQRRLGYLVHKVEEARHALRSCRGVNQNRAEQQRRRDELVTALEACAAEASASGTPLPYRLRDELRLYRELPP